MQRMSKIRLLGQDLEKSPSSAQKELIHVSELLASVCLPLGFTIKIFLPEFEQNDKEIRNKIFNRKFLYFSSGSFSSSFRSASNWNTSNVLQNAEEIRGNTVTITMIKPQKGFFVNPANLKDRVKICEGMITIL